MTVKDASISDRVVMKGQYMLQLGSLRQLILGCFFVALVPLIALLWQSQSDLAKVSKMTVSESQFVVSSVNEMKQLDSAMINLERVMLQYRVLQNDKIAELAESALERFEYEASTVCDIVLQGRECENIGLSLADLSLFREIEDDLLINAYIASLSEQVIRLRGLMSATIESHLETQQTNLSNMQSRQAWLTAILVSISLLLILLGSHLIVRSVGKIKSVIALLAKQEGPLPPLSKNAPKELVAVEKDLHWLGDRLEQLEHIRTALLRHAAHELKTPLASIKEGCSLLNDGAVGDLSKPQLEVLALLITSTQRLNTLVEKLLDYNLLLQQAQPTMVMLNIAEMVDDCLRDYKLALQHHKLDIDVTNEFVYADAELLRRIFDNLVSNAVAHGARHQPITIRVTLSEDLLLVDVANRGKRIPPEKVDNLFEPFIRGEGERNDNVIGTGLGLSIVSDCARLMHGSVNVIDVDFADVCFRVSIPQEDV